MLNRLLSHDLPRNRWLALMLVADRARPGVDALPLPGHQGAQRRREDPRLHRAGRRASTCCSATPASSASRTRCSSASAPTASRSRARGWGRAGARCCWASAAALVVSLLLSLVIGLFSLRVKAIFFAMITLAVAVGVPHAGLAAVGLHRRRGRPQLQGARGAAARHAVPRGAVARRHRSTGASSPTTCCSSRRWCWCW